MPTASQMWKAGNGRFPGALSSQGVLDSDGRPETTQRNSSRPAKLYRFIDYDLVKSIYR